MSPCICSVVGGLCLVRKMLRIRSYGLCVDKFQLSILMIIGIDTPL